MQTQQIKSEQEQQSFLQSQIAMSDILGEIEDAKETKRKPKISKSAIEKSKIHYEKFRGEKLKNYFLLYIGFIAFYIFASVIEKNTLNVYEISIFLFYFSFTVNLWEKSELGYVRKLMSEQDKKMLETVTYYVFKKVPKIRYITLLIFITITALFPFLINLTIPDLTTIAIILMLFIITILGAFWEFIFKGFLK